MTRFCTTSNASTIIAILLVECKPDGEVESAKNNVVAQNFDNHFACIQMAARNLKVKVACWFLLYWPVPVDVESLTKEADGQLV
jgi:hypothetical protein